MISHFNGTYTSGVGTGGHFSYLEVVGRDEGEGGGGGGGCRC